MSKLTIEDVRAIAERERPTLHEYMRCAQSILAIQMVELCTLAERALTMPEGLNAKQRRNFRSFLEGSDMIGTSAEPFAKAGLTLLVELDAAEQRATAAEAEVERLREALKPLAGAAVGIDDSDQDSYELWDHPAAMNLTVGDIRRAVAALTKGPADADR